MSRGRVGHDPWRVSPTGVRLALAAAVVVGIAALVVDPPTGLRITWFGIGCCAALVAGELLPVRVGRRVLAPVSTGASLAMATTPAVSRGETLSAWTIIAILWICFVTGAGLARLIGVSVSWDTMPARFLGAAVTAGVCRGVPMGGYDSMLLWVADRELSRPAAASLLLAAALLGGVVERILDVVVSWRDGERGLTSVLVGELGPVSWVGAAVVTTAPLVALTYPVVGVAALPLFLLPVSGVLVALRRYVEVQRMQGEMLGALSRLPEVAAGGRAGHPRRVASLSVLVARQIGLGDAQQRAVERAALLHDIGQVGLDVPLAWGVTLDAPAQQIDQMVAAGRRVISRSVELPGLSESLAAVHAPYRQLQQGYHLPIEARIIKVTNAFDDLTEGSWGKRVVDLALERLHLGLGYEYDPDVVEVLERVVAAQPQGPLRQT